MICDHVTFMATLLSSLVAAMSMLEGTGKGSRGEISAALDFRECPEVVGCHLDSHDHAGLQWH